MPEKLTTRLFNNLRDSFQSDWKLLSETEHFLASTPLQRNYEQQFAVWRKRLQTGKNDAVRASVREEITALRKMLRLEGYDLSLGAIQLIVKDFVNDDAFAMRDCFGCPENPTILNLPLIYSLNWNVSGCTSILKCIIFGSCGIGMLYYSAVPQPKQKRLLSGCENEPKQTHKKYCGI